MMTPLPEKATAPPATNSAPASRALRSSGAKLWPPRRVTWTCASSCRPRDPTRPTAMHAPSPNRLDAIRGTGEAPGLVLVVLGARERAFGGEQQRLDAVGVARGTREADRRAQSYAEEIEIERIVHAAREIFRAAFVLEIHGEHRELVVPDAPAQMLGSRHLREPLARFLEHAVACPVPDDRVHAPEAVDVREHQHAAVGRRSRRLEAVGGLDQEPGAGEQARHPIGPPGAMRIPATPQNKLGPRPAPGTE